MISRVRGYFEILERFFKNILQSLQIISVFRAVSQSAVSTRGPLLLGLIDPV
jgi:hypothetical protein